MVPHATHLRDWPEVDPGSVSSDIRAVAVLIDIHIQAIAKLIHYSDVVPEGRQWTIPVALDCGFDGELVIRVSSAGDCERSSIMATLTGGL